MDVQDVVARVTEHLLIAKTDDLVLENKYGLVKETTKLDKLMYAEEDPGHGGDQEHEDDDCAWPANLPTFGLADVIREGMRISTTVRPSMLSW